MVEEQGAVSVKEVEVVHHHLKLLSEKMAASKPESKFV